MLSLQSKKSITVISPHESQVADMDMNVTDNGMLKKILKRSTQYGPFRYRTGCIIAHNNSHLDNGLNEQVEFFCLKQSSFEETLGEKMLKQLLIRVNHLVCMIASIGNIH